MSDKLLYVMPAVLMLPDETLTKMGNNLSRPSVGETFRFYFPGDWKVKFRPALTRYEDASNTLILKHQGGKAYIFEMPGGKSVGVFDTWNVMIFTPPTDAEQNLYNNFTPLEEGLRFEIDLPDWNHPFVVENATHRYNAKTMTMFRTTDPTTKEKRILHIRPGLKSKSNSNGARYTVRPL